ncbi:MAG TPA: hypothetical protein VF296_04230 [Gallionella sp.]
MKPPRSAGKSPQAGQFQTVTAKVFWQDRQDFMHSFPAKSQRIWDVGARILTGTAPMLQLSAQSGKTDMAKIPQ